MDEDPTPVFTGETVYMSYGLSPIHSNISQLGKVDQPEIFHVSSEAIYILRTDITAEQAIVHP